MRIILLTETFPTKIDGIVNTLCYLLDHLATRSHKSILFAPEGGPTRYADTLIVGLPGIPFPLYPELKLVPPSIAVRKRLCAFQPDIVHVLNPFALGSSGLQQARALDLPAVASYHTDIPRFAMRWGFELLSDVLRNYLRWLHNQADLNLCPSRTTQMELDACEFKRTQIWSRGPVDVPCWKPCLGSISPL